MLQIYAAPSSRSAVTIIDGVVASLIESVGREQFPGRLFRAAHESIGCAHISAFAFDPQGRPAVIFAENAGPSAVAREIGDRYVERYWRMDPISDAGRADRPRFGLHMVEVTADDIPYADYRRECYTAANLGARMSVCEARSYGMIRLNFYRAHDFLPMQKSAIFDAVDLLMPLLWRHSLDHFEPLRRRGKPDFEARLAQVAPSLSPREREVCALIAAGLNSEGIALRLGVSLNTVLTYRKRSYSRLQISSQNELLRLLMG